MSALRTKMIYWSLRHVLLFSTLTQNHGCSAHNSDMQTSSASSICSVARNREHIMFPTLRARIGQCSTGWTEKKRGEIILHSLYLCRVFCNGINVVCLAAHFGLQMLFDLPDLPWIQTYFPCCCILLFLFGFFVPWILLKSLVRRLYNAVRMVIKVSHKEQVLTSSFYKFSDYNSPGVFPLCKVCTCF